MQDTIVSLLPSRALRDRIRETGHTFSERESALIIFRYAPTHRERIRLLLAACRDARAYVPFFRLAEWSDGA